MRPRLPTALLLVVAGLLPACGAGPPPSILLVTVDTLRLDAVGAFGNRDARTPRMDRLAATGARFSGVRAPCPLTLPSHLTILSGLLPPEHGFRDNDPPRPLPSRGARGFALLAERLSDSGYDTAAFVSSSVLSARTGISAGFRTYDEPGDAEPGALRYRERPGGDTAAAAAAWIAKSGEPFFAWVHLFDPHEPYLPPIAFRGGAAPDSPAAYADEVAYADRCVGLVLDALAAAGRDRSTLVVVTADHGEGLGEHGESTHGYLLYDATLRVPLIVRWPGHVAEGGERADPVSLADLAPALLRAALPAGEAGASFLDAPAGRPLFAESLYGWREMGWAQMTAVVLGGRKLIRGATDEAYDLAADPGEAAPLSAVPDGLPEELLAYARLPLRTGDAGDPELDPLEGFPYSNGPGRDRLRAGFLSEEENRRLPPPSPAFARELDAAKARVGRDPREDVDRELLELASRDPRNPSVPFWLGRNAMAAKDPERAAQWFEVAFGKGLSDTKLLSLWIQQLLLADRVEEAGRVVRERLPEVAPDAGTWVVVGAYRQVAGEPEEARRCLARAERLARTERDRELVSRFRHNLGQEKDQ